MRYRSSIRGTSLLALTVGQVAFAAQAEVPAVVADMPVAHSLVAMVAGDLIAPELLLEPGSDPHAFQLRPSQARAVSQADLVVWMGAELSPWMDRAMGSLSSGAALELLSLEGIGRQPYRDWPLTAAIEDAHDADHGHAPSHDHDHDDENDHEDEHDDDHDHRHDDDHGHAGHGDEHAHDHARGAFDPHAWMNPRNVAPWLDAIAAKLAELDPGNAETYRANAAESAARIAALEEEVATILAPVGEAGLVMYHDAYGYLATAFGLNVLGTIALGDAADPGAARLGTIRARLQEAGAACVFPEVNHPDAYVALVGEADGAVRIGAPLDPEGVMLEPGADLYPAMMRAMATAIADCVAGD